MTEQSKISLGPYVMRFFWIYVLMSVGVSVLIYSLKPDGNGIMGLSFGVLFGSAVAAGEKFVRDYKRGFHLDEKLKMILFSMLIILIVSILLLILSMEISAFINDTSFKVVRGAYMGLLDKFMKGFPQGIVFALVALGFIIQFLVFYVTYGPVINKIHERIDEFG